MVFAFIVLANFRSRSGGIIRSLAATAYQVGFVFHAAWVSFAPKAAPLSASEVSGFWMATAFRPAFSSSGITLAQLEPSAHAPCTRTTFRTLGALLSAAPEGCEVTAIVSAPTKINADRPNEPRIMCA